MSARLMGWMKDGKRLDAALGDEVRIGAVETSDIVVPIKGVSRSQARIVRDGQGYWIEDAGSKNGTLVNGAVVMRSALHHLDVISLGRVIDLVFVNRDGSAVAEGGERAVRLEHLDGSEQMLEIGPGVLTIGRDNASGLAIDSAAVSRSHARITNAAGNVTIEDLGSANGTLVNSRRIAGKTLLRDGDVIEIGDSRFRLQIKAVAPLVAPVPEPQVPPAPEPIVPDPPQPDQEWKTRILFLGDLAEELPALLRKPDLQVTQAPATAAALPPTVAPKAPAPLPATVAPKAPARLAPTAAPLRQRPAEPATAFAPADVLMAPQLGAAGSPAPAEEAGIPAGPRTVFGGSLDLAMPKLSFEPVPQVPASLQADPPTVRTAAPVRVIGVALRGTTGTFELPPGLSKVGRAPDCQMRLNDRDVSRWHASIIVTPAGVTIEDRGSANGTFVNGAAIQAPCRLESGSRVSFGQLDFSIELRLEGGQ